MADLPESIVIDHREPIRALILDAPSISSLRVGGVGLIERWTREFAGHAVESQVVSGDDLVTSMPKLSGRVILALGDWVMESLGHEVISEQAEKCAPDEVLALVAPDLRVAPVVCLGQEALRNTKIWSEWVTAEGLESLLSKFEKTGSRVRRLGFEALYFERIVDSTYAKKATWGLLKRLRYRPGGLVAKHLNRPISILMSRFLVDTRITANQVTCFSSLVGALGVFAIFLGGYCFTVLGGALLQINSILDGVDGELARLRLKTSEFGAYLDSVCDETLNAALFIAIGYNLWKGGGWMGEEWKPYLPIGIFLGAMSFIYSLVHWHCRWKHGLGFYWWFEAYKPRKEVQRSTSVFTYFKKLFWKESYLLLFFLFAVFRVYEVLLWVALPVAVNTVVFFFIHIALKRARW